VDWSYYDTNPVPAGAGQVRYFVNPIGAGGKTLADTNMIAAGQIPKAQHHRVTHIKSFFTSHAMHSSADIQTYYTLLKQTVFELVIANKYVYGQWTLQELFGIASLFAMTPAVAGDNVPMIQPRFHGIFPLNTPVQLSENTSFEVRITYTVAPVVYVIADLLMFSLYGKLSYAT
jgi:hypothetical protein